MIASRYLLTAALCALTAIGCSKDDSPTTPTPPAAPRTTTFASRITVGGSASRTFVTTQAGTVTVQLNSASTGPIGVGIGLPYGGVSTCTLSTSVEATPQNVPHIAAAVDNGSYCVAVYDLGNLTAPADFDITIVYP